MRQQINCGPGEGVAMVDIRTEEILFDYQIFEHFAKSKCYYQSMSGESYAGWVDDPHAVEIPVWDGCTPGLEITAGTLLWVARGSTPYFIKVQGHKVQFSLDLLPVPDECESEKQIQFQYFNPFSGTDNRAEITFMNPSRIRGINLEAVVFSWHAGIVHYMDIQKAPDFEGVSHTDKCLKLLRNTGGIYHWSGYSFDKKWEPNTGIIDIVADLPGWETRFNSIIPNPNGICDVGVIWKRKRECSHFDENDNPIYDTTNVYAFLEQSRGKYAHEMLTEVCEYEWEISIFEFFSMSKSDFDHALERKMIEDLRWAKSAEKPREEARELLLDNPTAYLTIADSVDAGNCEVGTKDFTKQFGIKGDRIKVSTLLAHPQFKEMLNIQAFQKTVVHVFG